jgi:hypothetical protein
VPDNLPAGIAFRGLAAAIRAAHYRAADPPTDYRNDILKLEAKALGTASPLGRSLPAVSRAFPREKALK